MNINEQLLDALKMVLDDPEALNGRPRTYQYVVETIAAAEQGRVEPVAWWYTLDYRGDRVDALVSAYRHNMAEGLSPFGREGIDYVNGGVVKEFGLYLNAAQPPALEVPFDHCALELAGLVMSDCGINPRSSEQLQERIAARIDRYASLAVRHAVEATEADQPPAVSVPDDAAILAHFHAAKDPDAHLHSDQREAAVDAAAAQKGGE